MSLHLYTGSFPSLCFGHVLLCLFGPKLTFRSSFFCIHEESCMLNCKIYGYKKKQHNEHWEFSFIQNEVYFGVFLKKLFWAWTELMSCLWGLWGLLRSQYTPGTHIPRKADCCWESVFTSFHHLIFQVHLSSSCLCFSCPFDCVYLLTWRHMFCTMECFNWNSVANCAFLTLCTLSFIT